MSDAHAGGGPENVVVVVNSKSAGSKEVANHYVRLRNIPASNVVALDYSGPKQSAIGQVFREQILEPVISAINDRGLALQIDTIAYSTDFPWRIVLKSDYPEDLEIGPQFTPIASITGATYLYRTVFAKSPVTVTTDSNWYFASAPGQSRATNAARCRQLGAVPSRAFRGRYGWQQDGKRTTKARQGRRYLLSTMLGVTTGRGNTVAEVIASLERAVEAEASPPDGTFYYLRNNDVRSQTRHGCFDSALTQLEKAGARARVTAGVLPTGAADVAGLMMGSANLPLAKAGMTIQPGAICEHLTSTGGVLFENGYQTPISELIRFGATGTSGTVAEPYAIQAKFPMPTLHLHYRRGCSLAESFYQSVASPYQLLILGDPLCQPWAKRPLLAVDGWPESDQELTPGLVSTFGFAELGLTESKPNTESAEGDSPEQENFALKVRPTVTPTGGATGTAYWELFIDGRLKMRLPSGKEVGFKAEQLGPGWHELRCVGFNPDAIEGQRRQDGQIELTTEGEKADSTVVRLTCSQPSAQLNGQVVVRASAPGAERIAIWHNSRGVGFIDGDSGEVRIDAAELGRGPVRLQAIAQPSGSASAPLAVEVN
ncbi:MAG: TIGR03790 family protein [Planctomycetota bacterium]